MNKMIFNHKFIKNYIYLQFNSTMSDLYVKLLFYLTKGLMYVTVKTSVRSRAMVT